MSDEPTQEESPEQRYNRVRAEEQQRHCYRTFTEPQDDGGSLYGFTCSCGEEEGEDLYSTRERRDAAAYWHVERACTRALSRRDA